MKIHFPDEYYYQESTSSIVPSDNPGVLNIDRAIAGGGKIFDEQVQALTSKKEKRKIIFNLSLEDWKQEDELLNHCILLLHEEFKIYGIGEQSLYPITVIDDDFIDKVVTKFRSHPSSIEEIKKLLPAIKGEAIIFDQQHLADLCDKNQFISLHPPFVENQGPFNEMPNYSFAITDTEAEAGDIIKYFSERPSIAIKTKKLRLIRFKFKEEGEVEKLFALLPNLEVLFLNHIYFIPIYDDSSISLSDLKLPALKKLCISYPVMIPAAIARSYFRLINAAPKLQILKLTGVSPEPKYKMSFGAQIKLFQINIDTLTWHTLILERVKIAGEQLSRLLSPSLVILYLKGCDSTNVRCTFEQNKDSPDLIKISVKDTDLSREVLSGLFTAFRNLKELNLSTARFTQKEFKVKPISISHNSLRKLIVGEDFFRYFKVESSFFPYLEYILLKSEQYKFGLNYDAIDTLIDLLKQFNDKDVLIEARSSSEIIFSSKSSHMELNVNVYLNDKFSLRSLKGVTGLDLRDRMLSEGELDAILYASPNLKCLSAEGLEITAELQSSSNNKISNKIETLALETFTSFPAKLFPRLKRLYLLGVGKISVVDLLLLSPSLKEIHLYRDNAVLEKYITLHVVKLNNFKGTLSQDCIVHFESLCVFEGDEKTVREFLDSHPNFEFSEPPLIKEMETVQKLNTFNPSHQSLALTLDPNYTQTMLIDRLCAYTHFILPKEVADSFNYTLLNGICGVVSKWCDDTVSEEGKMAWREKWDTIQQWDKKELPSADTIVGKTLNELCGYAQHWTILQLDLFSRSQVLTNQLEVFLKNPPQKPIRLSNAWHTTCLFVENNQWHYVDPNLKFGEPLVFNLDQTNELVAEIYRVLGHGLLITSDHEELSEAWSPDQVLIDRFCAEGGFIFLPQYDADSKKVDIACLSEEALGGIFLLSTHHKPFWFYYLLTFTQSNDLLAIKFSEHLLLSLTHYANTNKDELKNKISEGVRYLSSQDRNQLASSLKSVTQTEVITIILSALTFAPLPTQAVQYNWLPAVPIEEAKAKIKDISYLKEKIEKVATPAKSLTSSPPATTPALKNNHTLLASLLKISNDKNIRKESDESIEKFDHYLLGLYGKNVLLDIQDDSTLINYIHHLQAQPQAKDRGLFVINSPSDMQCAVRSLFLDERGKAMIKPAPSGPFYDFLNTHKTPIVVVNWQHLREGTGQQAYSMVEEIRRVEGIRFPKEALVLVLHHSKTEPAYLSNDFIKETFPAHFEVPPVSWPVVQFSEDDDVSEVVLELYNDPLWENHFYGYFKLEIEGLFFNDSPLLAALKAKPTALRLVLKNPPQRPDFKYVLNSWLKTGTLTKYGRSFELPNKIGREDQYGYDLAHLLANDRLQVIEGCLGQEDQYILNPTTLSSFFVNYDIDPDTKGAISLPGFLKLHQAAEMHIAVTQSISLSAWARLLMAAGHLKLRVKLCENVQLPPELAASVTIKPKKALSQALQAQSPIARLIVSDDISATKKILEEEAHPDLIVDVSELSKGDLFYALFPAKNSDPEYFLQLDEVRSDIWSALIFRDESLRTQTVLLTGSFSLELVDVLATFFKPGGGIYHRGHWKFPFGKLIVLTSELGGFTYVVHPEYRKETFDKKLQLLTEAEASRLLVKYSRSELATDPLSFLRSLATCESLPNKPRELLNPYLFSTISKVDEDFSLAYEQYISFKESRKLDFFNGLKKGPSVFVSGETGTGKSSFMHELEKEPDLKVFFGDILGWLETSRGEDNKEIQYAILFIDEANLNNVNYSFVEDLYNNSRNIFYKSCNSLLDPRFKVVFAGNAQNYGGERNLPTLFINHPNAITFGEMSNAYLFYEALLPILEEVEEVETAKEIARIFLRTYQEIKKGDNQAISTRELKQMANFYRAQKLPDDKVERAKCCAYQIARLVLTLEAQPSFDVWFQGRFGHIHFEQEPVPERMGRYKKGSDHKKKVLLVPSLKPVYHLLSTFIAVRTIRQGLPGKASYGGLSGLVLEGENGDKARRFVKEYLLGDGFVKRTIDAGVLRDFNYSEAKASNNVVPSKHFYYLSASLNLRATINLLIRAFHEGAVVIFVNTPQFKLLEPVINPLSMGEDLSGNRALVPGFSFILISKPNDSMSPAVKHRVMPCQFPCESEVEMTQILADEGCCSPSKASTYVSDFWPLRHRVPFKQFKHWVREHAQSQNHVPDEVATTQPGLTG